MASSPSRRRAVRVLLAIALVAPPVVLAVGAVAVFGGRAGSLAPLLVLAVAVVAIVVPRLSPTSQAHAAVREVCTGLISVLAGAGTWLAMVAVGIGAGIVPFVVSGSYPHADAWMVLSTVVALAAVPLAWWLVRRALLS